jgi:predicted P-loop ATPase
MIQTRRIEWVRAGVPSVDVPKQSFEFTNLLVSDVVPDLKNREVRPYARQPKKQRRQFIVVGTTNSHHYLADSTGNRRFWPVRLQRFDLEALRERDQLWAEAAHREAGGESIRLAPELYTHAALQQERRREVDPWEPILESAFGDRSKSFRLTYDDIYLKLEIPVFQRTEQTQKRVYHIMQSLAFKSMTVHNRDTQTKERGFGRDGKQELLPGVTDDVTNQVPD